MKQLYFADIFCGIGGFRMALDRNGCACVFSCDRDKYCRQTYAANFGDEPQSDIREIKESTIPSFDILCAGFPCQPFSLAGVSKKNSMGVKHGFKDKDQGNLFYEIVRIAKHHKPVILFLENVKNLKSHDGGRTYKTVVNELTKIGYDVSPCVVDAACFLPQHRERIYLVCFLRHKTNEILTDAVANFTFPDFPQKGLKKLGEILDLNPDPKYTLSDHLWQYLQDYAKKHAAQGHGFGFGLVGSDSVTRTLSARYGKDGSEILVRQDGRNPRRLTPRECARLMGFPETFEIPVSDAQAYHQFGNSVAVPVVETIAKAIIKHYYTYCTEKETHGLNE
jgi:DNA (cytosine-5)-methyltransferase 1